MEQVKNELFDVTNNFNMRALLLSVTNTLAYFGTERIADIKRFYDTGPQMFLRFQPFSKELKSN
jgi:hypothetical protein